jgi:hypothetical protein
VQANTDSVSWTFNHALAICSQSTNKLRGGWWALTGDAGFPAGTAPRSACCLTRHLWARPPSREFFSTFREQLRHSHSLNASPMFEGDVFAWMVRSPFEGDIEGIAETTWISTKLTAKVRRAEKCVVPGRDSANKDRRRVR